MLVPLTAQNPDKPNTVNAGLDQPADFVKDDKKMEESFGEEVAFMLDFQGTGFALCFNARIWHFTAAVHRLGSTSHRAPHCQSGAISKL